MTLPWIFLLIAGLLEVCWATGLRMTAGFSRPWPTAAVIAALAGSVVFLSLALRSLSVATAYAVWVGVGAAGTALACAAFYGERLSAPQCGFLLLLVAAIAGLKFTSPPL